MNFLSNVSDGMRLATAACFCVCLSVAGNAHAQDIWRVDATAMGAGTGTTWADAFTDLHDALASADAGDEVWVAAGRYTPSETDATIAFMLPSGVGLYGGFAGIETMRNQRDPSAHVTTLSADIGNDDVVGSGASWYLSWDRGTANSGHVIDASGAGAGTIIDGLVIADGATGPAGTPAGSSLMVGGGVYCVDGEVIIRDCTFTHHLAGFASGGAVYLFDASAVMERCRIVENYAHLGRGGGVFITGSGSLTMRDCDVARNVAVHGSGGGQGHGAGLAVQGAQALLVERCAFDQNLSKYFFSTGGLEPLYGGGLYIFLNPDATVRNSVFTRNTAAVGGGAFVWGAATFEGCLFANNTAREQPASVDLGGYGGGVGSASSRDEVLALLSCTVVNNTAPKYAGVYSSGVLDVRNDVIWGNLASDPEFVGYWAAQISDQFDRIHYSCVQDLFGPKKAGEDPLDPSDRPGCIEDDPMLVGGIVVDPFAYLPLAGSPIIDAGENVGVPTGLTIDLAGAPRFTDDPATPDTGAGTAPVVDMGALEFSVVMCRVDLDGDGSLTIFDFLVFQNAFDSGDLIADFDGDGVLTLFDFLAFQNEFDTGCP